jgi:hypothetical protein
LEYTQPVAISLLFAANVYAQTVTGFVSQQPWNERLLTFSFPPEVRVHINAPENLNPQFPTTLILYALPNGNTIEQTIGKKTAEGEDWHFDIQHIGAQTRRLREVLRHENIVVAYLETEGKSWPQWRRKFPNNGELIYRIVDSVRTSFKSLDPSVALSGHSGGGSFIFGFLNRVEIIPPFAKRISFLDSNYGYDDGEKHGDKLVQWLKRSRENFLSILAYDDRYITLNGKRVVSDTGGTFRATHRMLDRLRRDFRLTMKRDSVIEHYTEPNNQIDILIHTNPDTLILHTVLVEKNGFIHAMTSGTPYENRAGVFWREIEYSKWITK